MKQRKHESQVLELAVRWADKIGKSRAMLRLVDRGVSLAIADRICAGRYKSTPRGMLDTLLREEMSKDGFSINSVA